MLQLSQETVHRCHALPTSKTSGPVETEQKGGARCNPRETTPNTILKRKTDMFQCVWYCLIVVACYPLFSHSCGGYDSIDFNIIHQHEHFMNMTDPHFNNVTSTRQAFLWTPRIKELSEMNSWFVSRGARNRLKNSRNWWRLVVPLSLSLQYLFLAFFLSLCLEKLIRC